MGKVLAPAPEDWRDMGETVRHFLVGALLANPGHAQNSAPEGRISQSETAPCLT